jgi:predicted  nucleic acid-binding Zn-ribbon protein
VQNGVLRVEQRGPRESDWHLSGLSASAVVRSSTPSEADASVSTVQGSKSPMSEKDRKRAFNAPKRIARLEQLIEQTDARISEVDDCMMKNGSDLSVLVDLSKEKEQLGNRIAEYMNEWEELEKLLASLHST